MNARTLSLVPLALGGLLACGGHSAGDPAAPAKLDTTTALAYSASFLSDENNQAGENDGTGPVAAGAAMGLAEPSHPSCVAASVTSANSVTWTFTNCTGPHGWTWNGVVVITWIHNPDGSVLVKHEQRNMVGTKDAKTWTINGTKDLLKNPGTKIIQLSAEPGFTKAFTDGTVTTTYDYRCSLTADWSTAGQRKLYGGWSLTPRAGGEAVSATIPTATPLVWDRSADCCYPVSGTLNLTRGAKTATIVHALPCGSVTVNGEAKTLPPCSH